MGDQTNRIVAKSKSFSGQVSVDVYDKKLRDFKEGIVIPDLRIGIQKQKLGNSSSIQTDVVCVLSYKKLRGKRLLLYKKLRSKKLPKSLITLERNCSHFRSLRPQQLLRKTNHSKAYKLLRKDPKGLKGLVRYFSVLSGAHLDCVMKPLFLVEDQMSQHITFDNVSGTAWHYLISVERIADMWCPRTSEEACSFKVKSVNFLRELIEDTISIHKCHLFHGSFDQAYVRKTSSGQYVPKFWLPAIKILCENGQAVPTGDQLKKMQLEDCNHLADFVEKFVMHCQAEALYTTSEVSDLIERLRSKDVLLEEILQHAALLSAEKQMSVLRYVKTWVHKGDKLPYAIKEFHCAQWTKNKKFSKIIGSFKKRHRTYPRWDRDYPRVLHLVVDNVIDRRTRATSRLIIYDPTRPYLTFGRNDVIHFEDLSRVAKALFGGSVDSALRMLKFIYPLMIVDLVDHCRNKGQLGKYITSTT